MQQIGIGIIGLGTVGSSVIKLLKKNGSLIAERTGIELVLLKAADLRNRKDIAGKAYTKNANEVLNHPEISIVIETMGGVSPAKQFVLAAIRNGKHVVTSNKELIAKHGKEIFKAAAANGVTVLFEASVCGGIPILHTLRECLASNKISEVSGIVNGTTNYILSKMTNEDLGFEEALKQAQQKGYAEADPTMDVDGSDAVYKAAILAYVVSGAHVDPKNIYKEGITKITKADIEYAKEVGYVIKLLAIIKLNNGELEVRVHPTLVPNTHPLAKVSDNYNAVFVRSDAMGESMYYGLGAGGDPTASSVMSDVIELAKKTVNCGSCCGPETYKVKEKKVTLKKVEDIKGRYYLRMETLDKPGVLAGISSVFAKKKVSIQEVVQKESVGNVAQLVIILDNSREKDIRDALKKISKLSTVKKINNVIRVGAN
jgi:homoserine dehydrogenase